MALLTQVEITVSGSSNPISARRNLSNSLYLAQNVVNVGHSARRAVNRLQTCRVSKYVAVGIYESRNYSAPSAVNNLCDGKNCGRKIAPLPYPLNAPTPDEYRVGRRLHSTKRKDIPVHERNVRLLAVGSHDTTTGGKTEIETV